MSSDGQHGVHPSPGPSAYGAGGARPSGLGTLTKGCLIVGVAGTAVIVLLVVAVTLLVFGAAAGGAGQVIGYYRGVQVQEVTVSGTPSSPQVVLIPVRGILVPGGTPFGIHDPARVLSSMLDRAREQRAAAVILALNTPGGGITTCDVMLKMLKDFRREGGVPIVALMGDVAASGGYYVASAADHIMAHPTTITGSIGVMMPLYDASRLLRMLGVADRTVKSGEFKDLGSPFADKTPEERQRESQVLNDIVDHMHERFVQVVAEGRALEPEEVRKLADGRIYTSEQAQELKLIDSIGYERDAVEKAKELAGLTDVHLVEYGRARSLMEMLLLRSGGTDVTVHLDTLPGSAQAGDYLMYLWRPPTVGLAQ